MEILQKIGSCFTARKSIFGKPDIQGTIYVCLLSCLCQDNFYMQINACKTQEFRVKRIDNYSEIKVLWSNLNFVWLRFKILVSVLFIKTWWINERQLKFSSATFEEVWQAKQ